MNISLRVVWAWLHEPKKCFGQFGNKLVTMKAYTTLQKWNGYLDQYYLVKCLVLAIKYFQNKFVLTMNQWRLYECNLQFFCNSFVHWRYFIAKRNILFLLNNTDSITFSIFVKIVYDLDTLTSNKKETIISSSSYMRIID